MPANLEAESSLTNSPGSAAPATVNWRIVQLIRTAGWGAATLSLLGFGGAIARTADLASNFRVLYAFAMAPCSRPTSLGSGERDRRLPSLPSLHTRLRRDRGSRPSPRKSPGRKIREALDALA